VSTADADEGAVRRAKRADWAMKRRTQAAKAVAGAIELAVPLDTVCFLVVKAREFDAQVAPTDVESGSNPSDDRVVDVLEARADDPTQAELVGTIEALNEAELVDLVALMWIGRGDYTAEQWHEARGEAKRHRQVEKAAAYLLGTPLLADYLEEGLAAVGRSCLDAEMGRL
jgi:hypothetical protein